MPLVVHGGQDRPELVLCHEEAETLVLGTVEEGTTPVTAAAGIRSTRQDGEDTVVEAGSGAYRFAYPILKDGLGTTQR